MELLDRYLQAVRKYLPARRQDDIIAELRANMESQIEDKESELGHPLSIAELEALLKKMGPPLLVASRYQAQQYLIGPTLFPAYLYVLRVATLWASIIYLIVIAVVLPLTKQDAEGIVESLWHLPGLMISVAAWVTLAFAAIEFFAARYPDKFPTCAGYEWSPSSLPPLEKVQAGAGKPRTYTRAVAEAIFGFIFLAWLLLIPHHPFLLMGPGYVILHMMPFELMPIWWTFFWLIVALNVLQLIWKCVDLARGVWQYPNRVAQMLFKVCGLVPILLIIFARDHIYVALKNPAVDQAQYGHTLDQINKSVHFGFTVIFAIVILQLAFDLGKMVWDGYKEREAAQ